MGEATRLRPIPLHRALMPKVKATKKPGLRPPSPSGLIRTRIDPALKLQAEGILSRLGLKSSDAIRLFHEQITLSNGLPFPAHLPNAETRQALDEADAGMLTRHGDADAMFKKLGI